MTLRMILTVFYLLYSFIYIDKWLFVGFKIIIVLLAYIAFQLVFLKYYFDIQCFDTFVRPLFISVDEKIGMIIASLQDQWCSEEGCTPEEQRTIQAIVKNIKESGKRFW